VNASVSDNRIAVLHIIGVSLLGERVYYGVAREKAREKPSNKKRFFYVRSVMGLADRDYMKRGVEEDRSRPVGGRRPKVVRAPWVQRLKFAWWSLLRRLRLR
jgi:hypothetical protein